MLWVLAMARGEALGHAMWYHVGNYHYILILIGLALLHIKSISECNLIHGKHLLV